MIAWLNGRIIKRLADNVVLDVNGVGYQVFLSQQVMDQLPAEGQELALDIYTQVKEDAIQL